MSQLTDVGIEFGDQRAWWMMQSVRKDKDEHHEIEEALSTSVSRS